MSRLQLGARNLFGKQVREDTRRVRGDVKGRHVLAVAVCWAVCGIAFLQGASASALTQLSTPPFAVTWGWGVADGSSAFQRCMSGCQAGISGSGAGQFDEPRGVALDGDGNVYVADEQNSRIQKFTGEGVLLTEWAVGFPTGIAIGATGNVYVVEQGANKIHKFTASGASLTSWGSSGSAEGQFFLPRRVAVDLAGDVYVTDQQNHRIQAFDGGGTFLRMWGWGVDDGTAELQVCTSGCQAGISGSGDGQFNGAAGIAVDRSGNVYVTDGNARVQVFTAAGGFVTKWGSAGSGDGEFGGADGLAVDLSGHLYVADYGNARVQVFDATGTFLGKWGSSGSAEGEFTLPFDVAVGPERRVHVADTFNHRIQLFAPNLSFFVADGSPNRLGRRPRRAASSLASGNTGAY